MKKPSQNEYLIFTIHSKRTIFTRLKRIKIRRYKHSRTYCSRFLNEFYKITGKKERTIRQIIHNVTIPKNFSIITNPEDSLSTIYDFIMNTSSHKVKHVVFDHSNMESYDLAAESLLDIAAHEVRVKRKVENNKITVRGNFPNQNLKNAETTTRFLKGIGIIKSLQVKHEYLPAAEEEKLKIFQAKSSTSNNATSGASTHVETTVANFVQHMNTCLACVERELTPEGCGLLSDYTSELLINIKDHSGKELWRFSAYLDTTSEENYCEISIFNLGRSISETFARIDWDGYTGQQIAPYINIHGGNGFFTNTWTANDLMTLVALQGDVSSKNQSKLDTRGQGTVHLIQFFQRMSEECSGVPCGFNNATMAILSGSTHIYFDGKYKMERDSSGQAIIAFNDDNDLTKKPDKKYIKKLSYYFPGTIISIKFPLKPSFTKEATP